MKPKVVPKMANKKTLELFQGLQKSPFFLPNLVVFWIKKWGSFLGFFF
jgi:hypothetical protein